MESLLHGMLGFFPIGDAICSESDVVKLLVFQGASGGFGSSGLPESFFFLQDGDVEVSWCFLRSKSGDCSVIGDGAVRLLVCSVVGLLPEYLVVSPVLLELCFGSSMVTSEWVAGARSLTADVLLSRISCGFPMRGVGFLVQKEEEDGGGRLSGT